MSGYGLGPKRSNPGEVIVSMGPGPDVDGLGVSRLSGVAALRWIIKTQVK